MNRPSPRALSEWYMAQTKEDRICRDCGKTGPYYAVQAQHPYYADGLEGVSLCTDCITAINRRKNAERKAQFAAMERCSIDGCRMRGTYTVCGSVLMCGRHLHAAQREHSRRMSGFGGLGLFMTPNYGTDDIKAMATTKGMK